MKRAKCDERKITGKIDATDCDIRGQGKWRWGIECRGFLICGDGMTAHRKTSLRQARRVAERLGIEITKGE